MVESTNQRNSWLSKAFIKYRYIFKDGIYNIVRTGGSIFPQHHYMRKGVGDFVNGVRSFQFFPT